MSLTVTPTGIFSLPLKYLRATIAASAQFQAVVGAINETAALDKVIIAMANDKDSDETMPRAIIRPLSEDEFGRRNVVQMRSSNTGYTLALPMRLYFEFDVPAAYRSNMQDAFMDHLNKVGAIAAEMWSAKNSNPTAYLGQLSAITFERFGILDPDKRIKTDMAIVTEMVVEFDG